MEEENVQVNNESKKGFNYKKYLPYAGIALAVIILIFVLVSVFGGGPKKPVKDFVEGMSKKNASKIIKSIDFVGMNAWGYYYDEDNFSEEDYDELVKNYKEMSDKMNKDDLKDAKEVLEEGMKESFEGIDEAYKSYKMKIEKFEDVEKLGKDLYAIDAEISMKAKPQDKEEEEIDETEVITFVVYKDKVIYVSGLAL